jgi:hypothetical protein
MMVHDSSDLGTGNGGERDKRPLLHCKRLFSSWSRKVLKTSLSAALSPTFLIFYLYHGLSDGIRLQPHSAVGGHIFVQG